MAQSQSQSQSAAPAKLVVTCANRKMIRVQSDCHVHHYIEEGTPVEEWVSVWNQALETEPIKIPAKDMYGGAYWSIVRTLPEDPYIISAGHGVLDMKTRIQPYAATFASGQEDSIPARFAGDWWEALTASRGRRLQDLEEQLVVVASPSYLKAVARDLLRGGKVKAIISSQRDLTLYEFYDQFIIVPANLQNVYGGTLTSLYIQVARDVMKNPDKTPEEWTEELDSKSKSAGERNYPTRSRMGDEPIIEYITSHPGVSCFTLLSAFRAEGNACQQERWKKLYQEVRNGKPASNGVDVVSLEDEDILATSTAGSLLEE